MWRGNEVFGDFPVNIKQFDSATAHYYSLKFNAMKELIQIQQELKAPKKNKNTFGGYNYRSCEDILEAAKPICHKLGCFITLHDEIVEVGGRVYVKATATIHNSELLSVTTTAFAREEEIKKGMDAAQITGSASSYARKYALNGLLAIDDTKDPDCNELHPNFKPQQTTQSASSKKVVGAKELDDMKTRKALLDWAFEEYQKSSDKASFDAGKRLAEIREITEHNQKRFKEIFNLYLSQK